MKNIQTNSGLKVKTSVKAGGLSTRQPQPRRAQGPLRRQGRRPQQRQPQPRRPQGPLRRQGRWPHGHQPQPRRPQGPLRRQGRWPRRVNHNRGALKVRSAVKAGGLSTVNHNRAPWRSPKRERRHVLPSGRAAGSGVPDGADAREAPRRNRTRHWKRGSRRWSRADGPRIPIWRLTTSRSFATSRVVRRAATPRRPPPLEQLHVEDLYLACACAAGVGGAAARFEQRCGPRLKAVLATTVKSPDLRAEIRQRVLDVLLVGTVDAPAKISDYGGQGPLDSWTAVVAQRQLATLLRKDASEQRAREGAAMEAALDGAACHRRWRSRSSATAPSSSARWRTRCRCSRSAIACCCAFSSSARSASRTSARCTASRRRRPRAGWRPPAIGFRPRSSACCANACGASPDEIASLAGVRREPDRSQHLAPAQPRRRSALIRAPRRVRRARPSSPVVEL